MKYIYNKTKKHIKKIKSDEELKQIKDEYIIVPEDIKDKYMKLSTQGYDVEIDDNLNLHSIFNQKKFDLITNTKLNRFRVLRTALLEAFDKYKSNVNYGILSEDNETKIKIISWYNDLLNLVESAFEDNNIPSEIKHYLQ